MRRDIVPQCYSSCVPSITSRQNPIVARFRAVARGERSDRLLLDGVHLIEEALAAGLRVREAAVAPDRPDVAPLAERLRGADARVAAASAPVMQAISPVRSPSPIVAIADRPIAADGRAYAAVPLVVIAVDVQDPGNVGAIVRVAEAAGATGVVCAGACADPFGWKALRGSMGSALRLPVLVRPERQQAIEEARSRGCRLVAAVPRNGVSLYGADFRRAVAVLVGGEGPGLADEQLRAVDDRVVIPMEAPVESLNVAVSAALLLYEARRQRTTRLKSELNLKSQI
jgi:RNA methyltransferase, TrmH family